MKKVSQIFKQYKWMVGVTVLLMFFQTFGTLYIPTLMADIVNKGIMESNLPYIYAVGGRMILTAAVTAAVAICGAWLAASLGARWGRDIRTELFHKVQSFSVRDFNRFGTASMITRSTNDIAQLQDALILFMQLVLPAPMITIGGLLLAFSKDPQMALLILITLGIFLTVALIVCKKAIPLYQQLRLGMDDMNRTLREQITGIRVIRAFNQVVRERKRADRSFQSYGDNSIHINKIFAVMMPVVLVVINVCSLCIVWFGGKRVTAGAMEIGDIMALIEYALLIFWNLVMAVMMLMSFPRALTSAIRINEVLSVDIEIQDGADVVPPFKSAVPVLEFQNVTFRYAHAEEPVLSGISFACRAGQTTAIIGGTGSGKSTIANLIMRFHDIQGGEILLNGKDIREVPQQNLREHIGFVPQKAVLFSGTIADNLRYGKETADMEELKRAASIAQAADFIEENDAGYELRVSQGGSNFSGGQRQRLCIARALVNPAQLYVFDDSFSALDFQTDAKLREALRREIKDAAIVVVAQRVSSIVTADQIVVLDNGGIAGMGTHTELMKSCGIYQEIVKSQRKEEAVS